MRPPRSPAARRALGLWSDASLGDRVHTNVRWWTAPFPALEEEVPRAGDVLEVGCGHGLLSTYLALTSRDRRVLGVDIDRAKIAAARRAVARLEPGEADVSFRAIDPGEVPLVQGGWRSIVVADVLYLLARDQRDALLARCADALAPGGALVLKEVDTSPALKARASQLQEVLATRVLRITAGDTLDFPSASQLEGVLASLGLATRAGRLDRGYLHPHCVVVGTRSAGTRPA